MQVLEFKAGGEARSAVVEEAASGTVDGVNRGEAAD